MSSHYPPYIKTILKTGAIVHLIAIALGMFVSTNRYIQISRNGRPRRRFYKAGKFDSMLQVRDERHREIIRPLLDIQPGDVSKHLFQPLVFKNLD